MKSRIKVKPRVRAAAAPVRDSKDVQSSPYLTVCLFISSPEPSLSSLKSLKPLLQSISSELNVVHFDSLCLAEDSDWRAEAQSLGAHFVSSPWTEEGCSAVWNKGVREAKGKWVLLLKEAEVLEGASEIKTFLLSDGSASYSQGWLRVLGAAGEEYWADRLFRREPGFLLRYPVYERPCAAPGSRRILKEAVLRASSESGPAFCSQEEEAGALLQRQAETTEQKETALRAMACLAWNAHLKGKFDQAEELCRRLLEAFPELELDRACQSLKGWACAGIVRGKLARGEHQEAWEEAARLPGCCPPDSLEEACLRFWLMKAAGALSLPEAALEQAARYWECLRTLGLSLEQEEPAPEAVPDMPGLEEAVCKKRRVEALSCCARLSVQAGKIEDAFRCFSALPWEACQEDARDLLDSWGLLLEISRMQRQYDTLKDCLRRVQGMPHWMAVRAEQEKELHPEAAEDLTQALAAVDTREPAPYLLYQKTLLLGPDDKEQAITLLNQCANLHVCCVYPYQGLVLACLRYDLIPVTFCLDMEWEDWLDCVRYTVEHCRPEEIPAILEALEQRNYAHALPFLALPMALQVKRLTEYPPQTLEEARSALVGFSQYCQEYTAKRFRKELMDQHNWSLLPRICRMGMHVVQAFEMEELRLPAKARQEAEAALTILPGMRSAFAPLLAQWEEEENTAGLSAKKEFYLLAQQAKAEVAKLLANRQYQEAEKILEELETMLPGDPSIERLKNQAASLHPDRT